MIGSGVAHFSIPSSVNQSVGPCTKRVGKNDAKEGKGKGKRKKAKGKMHKLRAMRIGAVGPYPLPLTP